MANHKRWIALLICILLLNGMVPASAQVNQTITFMGIPWEKNAAQYIQEIHEKMPDIAELPDFFNVIGDIGDYTREQSMLLMNPYTLEESSVFKSPGVSLLIFVSDGTYTVYDYPLEYISGKAIYDVSNGVVNDDPNMCHIIEMTYKLDDELISNGEDAYYSLFSKLTSEFGKCDNVRVENLSIYGYGIRRRAVWWGKDSYIMIELQCEIDGSVRWLEITTGINDPFTLAENVKHPELTITSTSSDDKDSTELTDDQEHVFNPNDFLPKDFSEYNSKQLIAELHEYEMVAEPANIIIELREQITQGEEITVDQVKSALSTETILYVQEISGISIEEQIAVYLKTPESKLQYIVDASNYIIQLYQDEINARISSGTN